MSRSVDYYGGNMTCIDLGVQLTHVPHDEWTEVLANHEAMDIKNNTNVLPVVGAPVVYINNQAQPEQNARVVHIVAEELARKWTWAAEATSGGVKINFNEKYMRGGQACNSVITRCKQSFYELYPNDKIEFKVTQQPRRKDRLKGTGQKFLDAVLSWFGGSGAEVVVKSDNVANNPNVVTITVFALEYPETVQDQCWIALVCDDDKLIAFEHRRQGNDLHAQESLIEEMKQRVRNRLNNASIGFEVEIRAKRPDELREQANTWLETATTRSEGFAEWARSIVGYFS
jgi:hypothetical protein